VTVRRDLHEENRRSWNAATRAHESHRGEQARFLREGGSTLFPEEVELLGDLRGRTLLHLQCNAGQDTMSLARLGADATGVDISDVAIERARALSKATGIGAAFLRADVYDALDAFAREGRRFDVVFSSYGAIGWLSDVDAWADGVARALAADGRLVVVDFHPALLGYDDAWNRVAIAAEGEPESSREGVSDYVAAAGAALVPWGFETGDPVVSGASVCHEFTWPVPRIVAALLSAGLRVERLEEHPFVNGARLRPGMTLDSRRRWWPPPSHRDVPCMFGLIARAAR
jgi:SAM-dependent methyltransferase